MRRRGGQNVEAQKQAVQRYVHELRDLDPQLLLSEVPKPGFWSMERFSTERDGIILGTRGLRLGVENPRLLVIVEPHYERRLHTVVVEGFAIQEDRVEDLTDQDWAEINI